MRPITSRRRTFIRFIFAFALMFTCSLSAFAQSQGDTSQYDRGMPPQQAAGVSSLGSYASADLGVVNLSNGALSINLPLGQVGGRGFSAPISLNHSSKLWSATKGFEYALSQTDTGDVVFATYDDSANAPDYYNRVAPGWTIGGAPTLRARGMGISFNGNVAASPCTEGF